MNKRTEALIISLVLTGTAIVAGLTSDFAVDRDPLPETTAETAAPEPRLSPVVYDMDIPADVLRNYESSSHDTGDSLTIPAEDRVATDLRTEQAKPIALNDEQHSRT